MVSVSSASVGAVRHTVTGIVTVSDVTLRAAGGGVEGIQAPTDKADSKDIRAWHTMATLADG